MGSFVQISELRQYFESQQIKVEEVESSELFDNVKAIIEAFANIWKENDLKGKLNVLKYLVSPQLQFKWHLDTA